MLIFEEASGKDASSIKKSDLISDVIEDSLFRVELILKTESVFEFSILDIEFEKISTVGEFIEYVEGRSEIWNQYKTKNLSYESKTN